jgi:ketosteroid isomerase-like protein
VRISVSSSTRWLIVALSVILVSCANAQSAKPTPNAQDALYQTVVSLDTQLFNAVNQCDLKTLNALWADDAEFYHDKGGLMVGRQNIVDAIKNNLCGKVNRQLVAGTLEVYPLNGYGAVEIGVHRFYHPYEQDHGEVGEAKFIHVWQNKDGAWKITRVISYDHGAAK